MLLLSLALLLLLLLLPVRTLIVDPSDPTTMVVLLTAQLSSSSSSSSSSTSGSKLTKLGSGLMTFLFGESGLSWTPSELKTGVDLLRCREECRLSPLFSFSSLFSTSTMVQQREDELENSSAGTRIKINSLSK